LFVECVVSRWIWLQISSWASLPALSPQQWKTDALLAIWFSDP
jgi:hypothetical protein